MWDVQKHSTLVRRAACGFRPDALLFVAVRNANLQNILHTGNTGRLAKECHRVSKLYKCTKGNGDDRNQW